MRPLAYVQLMRPHHWVKNLLIFLPLIFGRQLFSLPALVATVAAFFSFSFMASAVYALNDIKDVDRDRQHPIKRKRPLPAGLLSKRQAAYCAIFLGALSLVLALALVPHLSFIALLVGYFFLNLAYSFFLKHEPVLDIMLISSLYLLRVYAGASAINGEVSGWLFLCIFFLSLFLVAGKRRAEIMGGSSSRKVLERYTQDFLQATMLMGVLCGLFTYALYTVTTQKSLGTLEIFLCSLVAIRMLYMTLVENKGEAPELLFLRDWPTLCGIAAWVAVNLGSLYGVGEFLKNLS